MRSDFDELKRFAIADILSVSGRQKTTETVDMHINTIIDIAFLKGQQESQSKVDALTLQVAEMKSRLNDAYTDGQSAMYAARQSKVDELQKRVDAAIYLLTSIKAENDLWGCDQVERQIELLEQALKGCQE